MAGCSQGSAVRLAETVAQPVGEESRRADTCHGGSDPFPSIIKPMITYALRLKGLTPETLPLERLSKYLAALADLVGRDTPVHFDKVSKGSAMLKVRVPEQHAHAVETRVRAAASAEPGSDLRRAYEQIDQLARGDGTSAEFRPPKGAVILQFPGAKTLQARALVVKEYGEINGRIIRLGGRDDTVPVGLLTPDDEVVSCTATLEQAKQLKAFLLEPVDIVLRGTGRWLRSPEGKWKIEEFKINDFLRMQDDSFDDELKKIKTVGSGWDDVEDAEQTLARLRYGV